MSETDARPGPSLDDAEHFDVLIVGAGISGIGAAYHLQQQCPDKSFLVLEQLDHFGGTWWTHHYPNLRSDSDPYTYAFRFKPWKGGPIAGGAEILSYLGEVIDENGLARHIRYRHAITRAEWSSEDSRWTLTADRGDAGAGETSAARGDAGAGEASTARFSAGFLWMCQGYYRQLKGYTPEWEGMADFKGQIVHPQEWPSEGLEVGGKKVVVIGSGATAATLVPALSDEADHVTLLQRSPTFYMTSHPKSVEDDDLSQIHVDEGWVYEIIRRKMLLEQARAGSGSIELSYASVSCGLALAIYFACMLQMAPRPVIM